MGVYHPQKMVSDYALNHFYYGCYAPTTLVFFGMKFSFGYGYLLVLVGGYFTFGISFSLILQSL